MPKRLVLSRTGAALCEPLTLASSFIRRTKGLLGRSALPAGDGLAIERCTMVHMFFMRFPIDVLFCSRDWKVLRVVHNLRPWRISPYILGAYFAVELPAGTAARHSVSQGDQLQLEFYSDGR